MDQHMLAPPGEWGSFRRGVGLLLTVALALGTAAVPEAWAADYYVNPGSGNDGNTGSSGSPWKTLTHALGQVISGDVVHLAAGLYDTPGNGETFPLALVDGVEILGDTANPATVVISAPVGVPVFFNNDTPLGATTRLAGVTLKHDGDSDWALMRFAVDTATMSPRIDHNHFAGSPTVGFHDQAITFYDDGPGDGVFTPVIDANSFTDLWIGTWLQNVTTGTGNVFSPVITNNTFTQCDSPIRYTMSATPEGTVGGLVQGNTCRNTTDNDVSVTFYPYGPGSGLLFNPTITDNDFQSGASTNVYCQLYGYSYSGNATFQPTISNNTMAATDYNVKMGGYYSSIDGDYTVAPVISGNTMTGASTAVDLSLTTLSVSDSSDRNVFSPTITNNTITVTGGTGVNVYLSQWSNGQMEGTATIAGNTISGAYTGVAWSMSYFSGGRGMDWSVIIANNTVTSPSADGIYFDMSSMSFSGTGIFNLTMEGNTITNAGGDGIGAYPAYSWFSSNQVTETVLVRGNTVTGSAGDGIWLYFSGQTSNTLDARITDNVLMGNGGSGLYLTSNDLGSNGILVACNIITGNDVGITQDVGNDPPADFGGGDRNSPGNNTLAGNTTRDFRNSDSDPVKAENNWWGSTNPVTIDNRISDDEESTGGAVDFQPFLTAAPVVSVQATVVDAVVNDVAPPGASVGDTLQYTAVLNTMGCGDVGVTFTAPVDPNTTVVPGSVTTTQGTVQSENPPTVAVGVMGSIPPVTITWRVVVNGGTSVQTQGTVTAYSSGTTLTDDPSTPAVADPTVTPLVGAGTVQFSVAAVSVGEGAGSVTLNVTRTGGTSGAITVNYASANGTAVAPGDYTAVSGQLTWADQDGATKQIVVPIVDDAIVEGNETFTVTLTDLQGNSFVGSPATVTVTIQDNDMAPIPTLGQWGLLLLSGLLLLVGSLLLRRRRWVGAAAVLLVGVALAGPARAASQAKPVKKDVHVTTLTGFSRAGGVVEMKLEDGSTLRVREGLLEVRQGHVKPDKGQARSQQRPSAEERRAQRVHRKQERVSARRAEALVPGTPVVVTVHRDRNGEIRGARVTVFDTLEHARAEQARKQAGRKHTEK